MFIIILDYLPIMLMSNDNAIALLFKSIVILGRYDGSYTVNVTAPDTITSWIVSAFSMSDQVGLGIANTYTVSKFKIKTFDVEIIYI